MLPFLKQGSFLDFPFLDKLKINKFKFKKKSHLHHPLYLCRQYSSGHCENETGPSQKMLINYSVYQSALFLDILEFSMLGIIKSLKLTFCMALHLSVYTSKTQLSLTTFRLINIFAMSLLLPLTQYPLSIIVSKSIQSHAYLSLR